MSERFLVVKGHELLGLVPDSGEGPRVCFSEIVKDPRFIKDIEEMEAKGYKFLNFGVFEGFGCEVLFEKVS